MGTNDRRDGAANACPAGARALRPFRRRARDTSSGCARRCGAGRTGSATGWTSRPSAPRRVADLARSDPTEADAYERAAPFWHCHAGLERYWRKRAEAEAHDPRWCGPLTRTARSTACGARSRRATAPRARPPMLNRIVGRRRPAGDGAGRRHASASAKHDVHLRRHRRVPDAHPGRGVEMARCRGSSRDGAWMTPRSIGRSHTTSGHSRPAAPARQKPYAFASRSRARATGSNDAAERDAPARIAAACWLPLDGDELADAARCTCSTAPLPRLRRDAPESRAGQPAALLAAR